LARPKSISGELLAESDCGYHNPTAIAIAAKTIIGAPYDGSITATCPEAILNRSKGDARTYQSVRQINVSTVIVSDHQFSDQNKRDLLKFVRNQKGQKGTGAGVTGDVEPLNP
jgi:hypothetical protein